MKEYVQLDLFDKSVYEIRKYYKLIFPFTLSTCYDDDDDDKARRVTVVTNEMLKPERLMAV